MKTSLIWRTSLLLIGLQVFALSGCREPDRAFITAFERSAQVAATSTNPLIGVSTVTDFLWDKLFVFGPYTAVQAIHEQLGFKWADAEKTHIESSDTFCLLVFVENGEVIRHIKFPRTSGEFHGLENGNVFSPTDDTFEVGSRKRIRATEPISNAQGKSELRRS